MTINKLFLLCFLVCCAPITVFASVQNPLTLQQEQVWETQREAYRNALKLLQKGQREQFQQAAEKLQDYALYPDLKFREYSRYIADVAKEDINGFLEEFGDSVLAMRLRQQWIQSLADKKDWNTYLSEYRPGQYTTKYDCYYYWAQYKSGSRDVAFEGARKLWLVGSSQDSACDPLFEVWKTTNKIDGALAWERMGLAIEKNQLQLARHLESYLPKPQKPIAQEWREVYRNPLRLKDINRYTKWGELAKPVVKSGFGRLIRKNSELALQLWPQYAKTFNFNADETGEILGEFGFVLGANYTENAEYWLAQALQYDSNRDLAPLAIRNALRKQDWVKARSWLALVDNHSSEEPEWRYWTARSDRRIGPIDPERMPRIRIDRYQVDVVSFYQRYLDALYSKKDFFTLLPESVLTQYFTDAAPDDILKDLAKERHYYGFLSAELLRQPLNLNQFPTQVSEEQLLNMASRPAIQRARELYLQNEIYASRLEWHYSINRMSEQDRSVAAHLAHLWDWNNAAILAAARSDAYDNLDIRFPTAHKSTVLQHSQKNGIDPDWVYSVIRQESAFLPMARSSVGALGMMQIMPATARHLARDMGISVPSQNDLMRPEANIRMGTFYLKQLADQFDGNIILATASYNAGPHRAKAWQPRYASMEGDIWVETIPFKETREYVKNILTYQAIYRHHLGEQVALSTALSSIPARQTTATAAR